MRNTIIYLIAFIFLSLSENTASKNLYNQKGRKMENSENANYMILGKYFIYSIIAYEDFEKKQKNIEDFIIYIKDEDNEIELTFHPNLAKGESPMLGGKTSLGRTVVYLISKKDKKIIKINYQK
ncbi:hypothetical protein ACPJXG_22595 [Janthinobacterium sp. NFX145]|uniref:hypothetical protein n=1 Tax=Janthinobacterium sp. NFX145 TaxID=3415602 RepID=UPI003CC6A500